MLTENMAQPQPQQGQAVDPNIAAILQQHQQQLNLLTQHHQTQQQQHQQAVQRAQQRETQEKQRHWVEKEKDKMDTCDGATQHSVREWIHAVQGAVNRVPQGLGVDDAIKELIEKTARGDLAEEHEVHLNNHPAGRAAVTHLAALNHLAQAFLGPDEAAVLKDNLKSLRQTKGDIPAYNRKYARAAAMAYPIVPRPADVEEALAEAYMGSLMDGKVKDRVFAADPRLVTLQAAQNMAAEEWARQRRRARVQRDARQEEPMDVGEMSVAEVNQTPMREVMAAMAASIRNLESQIQSLSTKSSEAKVRHCYVCNATTHLRRDCPKRKSKGRGGAGRGKGNQEN